MIDLSTSYFKSWLDCYHEGRYKILKKSDKELKRIYINPILINLEDQELFIKSEQETPTENKLDQNARNKVNDKTRDKCLKASDYAGCMKYETGDATNNEKHLKSLMLILNLIRGKIV